MSYEIRAMSLGEILDTGFRILRDHFSLLFGLAAFVGVPLIAVQMSASGLQGGEGVSPARLIPLLVFCLLYLVVLSIVPAVVTVAVGDVYLGRTATIGGSLRTALPKLMPLMGTFLLFALVMLVPMVVGGILVAVAGPSLGRWFSVLVIALLVIVTFRLGLSMLVLWQVCLLEETYGLAALRRSRSLTEGNLLRGLAITLLGAVLTSVMTWGIQMLFTFVPAPALAAIASGLAQGLGMAFTSALAVIFYVDLRCRKEAFDIDHLAASVLANSPG